MKNNTEDDSLNQCFEPHISKLEVSSHTAQHLQNSGINYISELENITKAEMLEKYTFDPLSLNELIILLDEMDLSFKAGNNEDVLAYYYKWTENEPDAVATWVYFGNHYRKVGKSEDAINAYLQVVRIDPENVDAWYCLGLAYRDTGNSSKAISTYLEAIRLNQEKADKCCSSIRGAERNYSQPAEGTDTNKRISIIDQENAGKNSTRGLVSGAKSKAGETNHAHRNDPVQKTKKVLVVDDDEYLVSRMVSLLNITPEYYAKGIVYSGNKERFCEIFEDIRCACFDVVLLGVVMPGVNGVDMTKMIRIKGFTIPVILWTGWGDPLIALEAMILDVSNVIIKPVEMDELILSIETILKEKQPPTTTIFSNYNDIPQIRIDVPNFNGVIRKYQKTGRLMAELNYKDGKLHGDYKVYRKCGTLLVESHFQNGLAHGMTTWFGYNGQVMAIREF